MKSSLIFFIESPIPTQSKCTVLLYLILNTHLIGCEHKTRIIVTTEVILRQTTIITNQKVLVICQTFLSFKLCHKMYINISHRQSICRHNKYSGTQLFTKY